MDLRRIFRKVPKALDAGGGDDASPLGDAIAANEVTRKKQMLLLGSAGAAALVAGSLYIFDDTGTVSYTHLDVYKRQSHSSPQAGQGAFSVLVLLGISAFCHKKITMHLRING